MGSQKNTTDLKTQKKASVTGYERTYGVVQKWGMAKFHPNKYRELKKK